jgi:hypothetical protein
MKNIFEQNNYLIGYIVIIFIIARLPYIGVAIRLFNTLIHESAHALVAILTSGKIFKIELQSNTSGSMLSVSKNKFSQFLIALAGYPLAAFTGYLFFFLLSKGYSYSILIGVGFLSAIVLVSFVRNTFGVFWSLLFLGIISYLLYQNNSKVNDYAVSTLAIILMTEAVFSSLILLLIAVETPSESGDAKILSTITFLPSIIWALCFVVINGFIVYRIIFDFLIY